MRKLSIEGSAPDHRQLHRRAPALPFRQEPLHLWLVVRRIVGTFDHGNVGREPRRDDERHDPGPHQEASATVEGITTILDPAEWDVLTAEEHVRDLLSRVGRTAELHDVVVHATRRA